MTGIGRVVLVLAACWVLSGLAAAGAGDVPRGPAKEPTYQTKAPRYCLLEFGPRRPDRVWLVHDGDSLYVDRNGSGDLTAADKKVTAEKVTGPGAVEGQCRFKAGELRVGGRVHKGLQVWATPLKTLGASTKSLPNAKAALVADPNALVYSLTLDVAWPGLTGKGVDGRVIQWAGNADSEGTLLFGQRPADAPVVRIGSGPLQVRLVEAPKALKLGRDNNLYPSVGTAGRGPGTFAPIAYEDTIPAEVVAVVDAAFPAASPGGLPVRKRYELKERC
jgi:hypothetical protein